MKIYKIIGSINLFEEGYIFTGRQNESNISKLNPKFRFSVKEYEVIEETDEYYVRQNDGYYNPMYSHKKYKENYDYDFEDEVIDHPYVTQELSYEISVSMPTTNPNLEEAKKVLSDFLVKRLEVEVLKLRKLANAISQTNEWEKANE